MSTKRTDWLTIDEIAEMLRVSDDLVRAWIKSGQLLPTNVAASPNARRPVYRVGVGEFERFMRERTVRSKETPPREPERKQGHALSFV